MMDLEADLTEEELNQLNAAGLLAPEENIPAVMQDLPTGSTRAKLAIIAPIPDPESKCHTVLGVAYLYGVYLPMKESVITGVFCEKDRRFHYRTPDGDVDVTCEILSETEFREGSFASDDDDDDRDDDDDDDRDDDDDDFDDDDDDDDDDFDDDDDDD
jgi:hypothetical protein